MVSLGFHYFTDTIGGAAVGTATVLVSAFVIDWAAASRQRRCPATSAGRPLD
jgi:membrane-associated phospholipid phosphatase